MHSSQSASYAHPSRPHPKHRTSTSISDYLSLKRLLATPGTGERSPLKAAFGLGGKDKSKEPLKIDTSITPPVEGSRRRPGPLDISAAQKQGIAQPLPSALATARIIEDISSISYPEGIKSPKIELNVNAKQGKFRFVITFYILLGPTSRYMIVMIVTSSSSLWQSVRRSPTLSLPWTPLVSSQSIRVSL